MESNRIKASNVELLRDGIGKEHKSEQLHWNLEFEKKKSNKFNIHPFHAVVLYSEFSHPMSSILRSCESNLNLQKAQPLNILSILCALHSIVTPNLLQFLSLNYLSLIVDLWMLCMHTIPKNKIQMFS